MATKIEPKRRAGLPPREKPKPVTPAFGNGGAGIAIAGDPSHWAGTFGRGPVEPPPVKETVVVKPVRAVIDRFPPAVSMYVGVDLVDPSPFQPRREFAAADIQELADSIAANGLVHAIVVRRRPQGESPSTPCRYELLAGERRLRAVRLLKQAAIRADVQERTDAEARAMILAENLQRKDLDPIEQARAMQAVLAAGDFPTQVELGKALGISQGQVSNTLRLLDLPDNLQGRLISGEITVGQARAILPYVGHPRLLAEIDKDIGRSTKKGPRHYRALPPAEEFGTVIDDAARRIGRRIRSAGDRDWDEKRGRYFHCYVPPAKLAEELEIIEVDEYGNGQVEARYALNKARFEALEREHRENQLAREGAKSHGRKEGETAKARKGETAKGSPVPVRKLSPTKQKQQQEGERRREAARRAEQARLTAERVRVWRINRLREAIAGDLTAQPPKADLFMAGERIALWFLMSPEAWHLHGSNADRHAQDRRDLFSSVLRSDGAPPCRDLWKAIAGLDPAAVPDRSRDLLGQLVWCSSGGPRIPIPDAVVTGMAELCRVDLGALWKTDQKGAAGQAYFGLHTREQLVELGKELGVHLDADKDKATMIRLLTTAGKTLPLPRELRKDGPGARRRR